MRRAIRGSPQLRFLNKVELPVAEVVSGLAPWPIRVLLADDHAIFRQSLRLFLRTEPDLTVVGEAQNASDAVRLVRELDPDVLVLDVAIPVMSGFEVLRQLSESATRVRVILLSSALRSEVPRALKLGARGVVAKESTVEVLLTAIRAVAAGEYWLGRDVIGGLVEALLGPKGEPSRNAEKVPFRLTKRELELVALVVSGYSNKEIAEQCSLQVNTVKHHLSNIFDKTGASSRLELALFALYNKLVAM
jgi:two-component system, NarL family, nitrate/nitrite response regulator NarL